MKKTKLFLSRSLPARHVVIGGGKSIKSVHISTKAQLMLIAVMGLMVAFMGNTVAFYFKYNRQLEKAYETASMAETQYRALLSEMTVYKDHIAKISADLDQNQNQIASLLEGTTPLSNVKRTNSSTVLSRLSRIKQGVLSLAFHREAEDITASQEKERIRLFNDQERIKTEISYLDKNLTKKTTPNIPAHLEKADMNVRKAILQRDLALSQTKMLFERVKDLELLVEEMQNAHFMTLERVAKMADGGNTAVTKKLSDIMPQLQRYEKEFGRLVAGIRQQNERKNGVGGPYVPVSEDLDSTGLKQAALNKKLKETHKKLDAWEEHIALYDVLPLGQPTYNYRVSCAYGPRLDPFNRGRSMHDGIDLATKSGTPVYATAPGVVTFAGSAGSYGLMIEVTHGQGIKSRFAHLKSYSVKKGDKVTPGQKIAEVGNTGRSTGPHLHYELRMGDKTVNPTNFMRVARNAKKSS